MLSLEAPSVAINKHVALVSTSLPLEIEIVVLLDELLRGVNEVSKGRVGLRGQGARCLRLGDTRTRVGWTLRARRGTVSPVLTFEYFLFNSSKVIGMNSASSLHPLLAARWNSCMKCPRTAL